MKNRKIMKLIIVGIIFLFIGASAVPTMSSNLKHQEKEYFTSEPVSRVREGGTPYNPEQSLYPYAIKASKNRDSPTSGLIESPPEYAPTQGVLYCYHSGQWTDVVRDLVVALTKDSQYDEIAYVVVSSTSEMNSATNAFIGGGADMSKVEFLLIPNDALWIRDYGPHFIYQDGALCLVDSHYYPTRDLDNFVPTRIGDDNFIMPTYDMGLYYSGGNFQPGPNRTGFVTELVNTDNPSSAGFTSTFIAELYQQYQGIDELHVMPQLPGSVDGTGHIDMWMNIVDENSVIISEFKAGSNPTAISITNNAVNYMEALGFEVFRTPAWNVGYDHYTYTNAFRVNDRFFIPTYGDGNSAYRDEDEAARESFARAAGEDVEIVQIDCYDIIPAAGAIHCIVMQVPRYTNPEPSVHVIHPDGGELFVGGTTQTIEWVATDTYNAVIPQIDLYYSIDGGDNYIYIDTTTDDGCYDWTVPELFTSEAIIKVVATSSDLDQGEGVSTNVFSIAIADQTVYNFAIGAGIDKYGWGHQTSSWTSVNNDRTPVSSEISSLVSGAYTKISYSDATGGDSDTSRYISPSPSSNYESTHTFELTIYEDPAEIDDIEILWEGYADHCTQVELYVWDYISGQWSDAEGNYGQNRFMDNWAGNRDGYLKANIRDNFDRYVDGNGQMTLLLYSERGTFYYYGYYYMKTFHDFLQVTVSYGSSIPPEITNINYIPTTTNVNGWVNISCDVTSTIGINQVTANITRPDLSTTEYLMSNIAGTDTYYYNTTYTTVGNYNFYITAEDAFSVETTSDIYSFFVGLCGDANGDESVNVGDAVYLINYVFSGGPAPNPVCIGDANGDGDVNVGDAVYVINYVFNGGPAPVENCCS